MNTNNTNTNTNTDIDNNQQVNNKNIANYITNKNLLEKYNNFVAGKIKEHKEIWNKVLDIDDEFIPPEVITDLENTIEKQIIDILTKNKNDYSNKEQRLQEIINNRSNPFFSIINNDSNDNNNYQIILDANTGILWSIILSFNSDNDYNNILDLNWKSPSKNELFEFAKQLKNYNNSLHSGEGYSLCNQNFWCVEDEKTIDLSITEEPKISDQPKGGMIVGCYIVENNNFSKLYKILEKNNLQIQECNKENNFFKIENIENKIIIDDNFDFETNIKVNVFNENSNILKKAIIKVFTKIDKQRCEDLDDIPEGDLTTESNIGIWEFYNLEQTDYKNAQEIKNKMEKMGFRGCDPKKSVNRYKVGIDFGTSGTVVALSSKNGTRLLEIGGNKYRQDQADFFKRYENPTVLQFMDYESFKNAWTGRLKMPKVKWKDVICSHSASENLKNSNSNENIDELSSIFYRLKQEVLDDEEQDDDAIKNFKDKITKTEHQLNLKLSSDFYNKFSNLENLSDEEIENLDFNADTYSVDLIEIYAWFLGLFINQRNTETNGIHTTYYLSYPVAYPQEAKNKICNAFKRGLFRSLPKQLQLAEYCKEKSSSFSVEMKAPEPVAYLIGAYKELGIKPTDEGIYYGVFDFGGGTVDFDFGLFRKSTDDEYEEDGYNVAIEQYGNGGDKYLGGENLLELLAYEVFKNNKEECHKKGIKFIIPKTENIAEFPEASNFIQKRSSRIASANMVSLTKKLRSIFEKGGIDEEGKINTTIDQLTSIPFLDTSGNSVTANFGINIAELIELLRERIEKGCEKFLNSLKEALFDNNEKFPQEVKIILAGNASRSQIAMELFNVLDNLQNTNTKQNTTITITNENTYDGLATIDNIDTIKNTNIISSNNITNNNINTYAKKRLETENKLRTVAKNIFADKLPVFKIIKALEPKNDFINRKPTAKTAVAMGLLEINNVNIINKSKSLFNFYVGKRNRDGDGFEVILKPKTEHEKWFELCPINKESRDTKDELHYSQSANIVNINDAANYGAIKFLDIDTSDNKKYRAWIKIIAYNKIMICAVEKGKDPNKDGIDCFNEQELILKI